MRRGNITELITNGDLDLVFALLRSTSFTTFAVVFVLAVAGAAAVAVVLAEVDCDEGLGKFDTGEEVTICGFLEEEHRLTYEIWLVVFRALPSSPDGQSSCGVAKSRSCVVSRVVCNIVSNAVMF